MERKKVSLLFFALFLLETTNCFNNLEIYNGSLLNALREFEPEFQQLDIVSKGPVCDSYKDFVEGRNVSSVLKFPNLSWLLQMIDATAKPSHSVLEGNVMNLGGYDQCMKIDQMTGRGRVKGKYCLRALSVNLTLPGEKKLPLKFSLCVPHSCQMPDVNLTSSISLNFACQTVDDYEWNPEDWVALGFVIALLCIVSISTAYDVYIYKNEKKAQHPTLVAFSLFTNGKKLFAVSKSEQIGCLNGIRIISMFWIIVGHRYANLYLIPVDNSIDEMKIATGIDGFFIPGARVAVDTFFFLSAFLLAYNCLKNIQKQPLTVQKVPMLYVHRLFRILPAYTAVFFLDITLLWRLTSGPYHVLYQKTHKDACHKYWWSYFLFVQNYVNPEQMCIVPTWYMSADMQLFLLSPILIIPLTQLRLKGRKKIAYIVCTISAIIATLIPMTIDFYREIPNIYETHPRLGTYILGILLGMIMVDYKTVKVKISPIINLLLWAISLGVMAAIVVCLYKVEFTPEKLKNNLFFTFTRPAWCIGLSWIIFACAKGLGGPVNWFLSKSIFQIMTRLTFSMYLLHNLVIGVATSANRVTQHFSILFTTYFVCGDYFFTFIASIVWVLIFESPMVVLEKWLFGNAGKKTTERAPETKTAEA